MVISKGSPYRPEALHKAYLQIKSLDDCRLNFGSSAPGGIKDHFICAHAPGKDACSVSFFFFFLSFYFQCVGVLIQFTATVFSRWESPEICHF